MAAGQIVMSGATAMIAAGVESISSIRTREDDDTGMDPWIVAHKPELYLAMIDITDIVASRYKISREAQDRFALRRQQRTEAAEDAGSHADEIVPVTTTMAVKSRETSEMAKGGGHRVGRYLQSQRHHLRGFAGCHRSWDRASL